MRHLSLAIIIFVSLSIAYSMPIKGLGPPILMSEVIRVGSGVQVLRQSLHTEDPRTGNPLTEKEKLTPKAVTVIDVTPHGVIVAPVITRQPANRKVPGPQANLYLEAVDGRTKLNDDAVIDISRMIEVPRTQLFQLPDGKNMFKVKPGETKALTELAHALSDETPSPPEPRRKSMR